MDDDDLKAPCAWCGKRVMFDWDGKELLMRYHDYPRFTRRICTGARKSPLDHLTKMAEDNGEYDLN